MPASIHSDWSSAAAALIYFCCGEIEQAVGFAWINSAWYPQLSDWYEQKADEWCAQKERNQAEAMEAEMLEEELPHEECEMVEA